MERWLDEEGKNVLCVCVRMTEIKKSLYRGMFGENI